MRFEGAIGIAAVLFAVGCDEVSKDESKGDKASKPAAAPEEGGADGDAKGAASADPAPPPADGGDAAPKTLKLDVFPQHAALSPDGSMLAVTGMKQMKVFDVASGKLVHDGFEPMTITNDDRPCVPMRLWWTTDGFVWAQCDSGIRGYDPKSGKVHATARWPDMAGIGAHDVALDGSRVVMGQGFAKYFVLYDVAADEVTKVDYEVPSASGRIGARTARFSANGEVVSLKFDDGIYYFGVDGKELDDPAKVLAGTIDEAAARADALFDRKLLRPDGATCRFDSGEVVCRRSKGADADPAGKLPPRPSSPPDGVSSPTPKRAHALDGSRVADLYTAEGGGTVAVVTDLDLW